MGGLVLETGRRTSRALGREQFWTMMLGCGRGVELVALRMREGPAVFVEVGLVGVGCRHSYWVLV